MTTTRQKFAAWFQRPRDKRVTARIQVRIDRRMLGNAGDVRPVGDAASEPRIDHGPENRIHYVRRSNALIVLLAGGDKRTKPRINWLERFRRIPVEDITTLPWTTEITWQRRKTRPHHPGSRCGGRSKGMTELARKTGRERQSLYKALSKDGRPGFATILGVVRVLGLKLTVTAG